MLEHCLLHQIELLFGHLCAKLVGDFFVHGGDGKLLFVLINTLIHFGVVCKPKFLVVSSGYECQPPRNTIKPSQRWLTLIFGGGRKGLETDHPKFFSFFIIIFLEKGIGEFFRVANWLRGLLKPR